MTYSNEVKVLSKEIDRLWSLREIVSPSRENLSKIEKRVQEIENATLDEWGYCAFDEETLQALNIMLSKVD